MTASGGPGNGHGRPGRALTAVVGMTVLVLTASACATGSTGGANRSAGAGSTTSASSGPGPGPSTTEEDALGGPGAPTVAGPVVAPGGGGRTGPAACRPGDPLADVYHPERLHVVSACMTVAGTVRSVHAEPDGDVHFDLQVDPPYTNLLTPASYSGQHGWLVDEIVPADEPGCTPGTPPRPPTGTYDYGICSGADESAPARGGHVWVTGPYVLDEGHQGWAEIHPVWAVSESAPSTTPPPPAPTTTAAAASGSCTASVSNPTPGDGGDETVSVTSDLPGTAGTVTAHYKTTDHPFSIQTDGSGRATVTFSIGHPTVGYMVRVDVDLSGRASCSTSFTPQ